MGSIYFQKMPIVLAVDATVNRILFCAVYMFSFPVVCLLCE